MAGRLDSLRWWYTFLTNMNLTVPEKSVLVRITFTELRDAPDMFEAVRGRFRDLGVPVTHGTFTWLRGSRKKDS